MIRNLVHALVAAAFIAVIGWWAGLPAVHQQLAGSQGARYAIGSLLVVLALYVLVSVVRAFTPKKKPRPSFTPAPPRRGR